MSAGFPRNRRRQRTHRAAGRSAISRELLLAYYPPVLTVLIALLLGMGLISFLEGQLRPVLLTAARIQTQNHVTRVLEDAVMEELDRQGFDYDALITIRRGESGNITAITTDMAGMNRLRGRVLEQLLPAVEEIDAHAISIPVGSLVESELFWGRGPTIKVQSFTVGTVTAEFESEFISAGLNQTLHRIWLEICVPTTVLLPGTRMDVAVETRLRVAETVIVGQVPDYIQKAN